MGPAFAPGIWVTRTDGLQIRSCDTNRAEETDPVRVTTALKRLMDLPGVTVTAVVFEPSRVVVTVKLRSRKRYCPECQDTTNACYDTRPVSSSWRHFDLGRWRLEVRADLRWVDCPTQAPAPRR